MIIENKSKERIVRVERAEADGLLYEYRLLVKESTKLASYGLPLYSISIEMTDESGVKSSFTLSEAFVEAEKAFHFFDKLVENLATPIDLPYVFEDDYK